MKKILLSSMIVLCCVIPSLAQEKPTSKIKGIEVGTHLLSAGADYLVVINAYAGLVLPTKFENINWTIGIVYFEGFDIGVYSGIDGYWGIFTAGASVGLSTIGENKGLNANVSIGLKLGWEKIYFRPQISMMIMGQDAFIGFKLPLTITF